VEAQHFVECIQQGKRPISAGEEGATVVAVLEHGQESLDRGGEVISIGESVHSLRQAA
jgi:predicted dehydrogenase